LMMRLQSDLVPLLLACATGDLDALAPPVWTDAACATVIMAAKGYPGAYKKNLPLTLPAETGQGRNIQIFQAGTALGEAGHLVSAGGRVLAVTALAPTLKEAVGAAYQEIDRIDFAGGFYRRDIGIKVSS